MVNLVWVTISFSLGLLGYIIIPLFAAPLGISARQKIGTHYYQLAVRSLQRVAIVQRVLGGVDLKRFDMDDENKVGKVTLDSGLIGSDKTLEFTDPANRILRLYDKPLTVLVEGVPAAIDAELAELGYWAREQDIQTGLEELDDDQQPVGVMPYVQMQTSLRVADPVDVTALLVKAIEPRDIETARELTKKRFEKYGSSIGMAETFSLAIGYAVGVGSVAAMEYVRVQLLDQAPAGGGGGPLPPIPPGLMTGLELLGEGVVLFA